MEIGFQCNGAQCNGFQCRGAQCGQVHCSRETFHRFNNKVMNKIINSDPDTYIIFYDPDCKYCMNSIYLFRDNAVAYKGYQIHKIPGGLKTLLNIFKCNSEELEFNNYHTTKPLIFHNGKFVGGYDELKEYMIQ